MYNAMHNDYAVPKYMYMYFIIRKFYVHVQYSNICTCTCVHFVSAFFYLYMYALQLKLHISLNTLLTFVVLRLYCILFRVGGKMYELGQK